MTPSDVLKLIKEKQVKFADLRFTDTRGKEQHVSIPAQLVDEDLFRDGKMFDGSSIAGWKTRISAWPGCNAFASTPVHSGGPSSSARSSRMWRSTAAISPAPTSRTSDAPESTCGGPDSTVCAASRPSPARRSVTTSLPL